jgi:hypothetical protein
LKVGDKVIEVDAVRLGEIFGPFGRVFGSDDLYGFLVPDIVIADADVAVELHYLKASYKDFGFFE